MPMNILSTNDAKVILTELKKEDRNFIVAVHTATKTSNYA